MNRRQSQPKGAALTPALVIAKAKSDSLQNIKNLNLWGNDLEDLKLIRQMPSLEVLSLSVNRISSLRDFSYCPKLRQLFLRKNKIKDITEIRHLVNLKHLAQLWLHDNDCAEIQNYREIVIKTLPHLQKLDNIDVTSQERKRAQNLMFDLNYAYRHGDDHENYLTNSPKKNQSQHSEQKRPSTGTKDQRSREQILRDQRKQQFQRDSASKQQQRRLDEQRSRFEYQEQDHDDHRQQPPSFQRQLPNFSQKPSVFPKLGQRQNRKEAPRVSNYTIEEKNRSIMPTQRNKHVLLAIMTLLKQLDEQSLQIVGAQVNKLLG